mgnify:CR=1 FL=1
MRHADPTPSLPSTPRGSVGEVARLFLRLGLTAFGGPAAHIAMMEDEIVVRRRWLTRDRFLDLLGATNLIPGPNSTELAIHIGHARAGWWGLVVAGVCFILPAACIVTALAALYVRHGALPQVAGLLSGVKPVVIAIVLQALWRLGHTAITSRLLVGVALFALCMNAFGVHELAVLAIAGACVAVVRATASTAPPDAASPAPLLFAPLAPVTPLATTTAGATMTTTIAATTAFGLWPLFAFFVKIGAVLFGSGYVLLAFLRTGLVVERGWLTETQLLDAIAIGQVTPGPVFTTATFIGYLLGGGAGALVATVGIFLPAFLFVAVSGPLVPRLRRSPLAGAVLDGVTIASLAIMAVATARLATSALVDPVTIAIAVVSAVVLLRWRVGSMWLVGAGALVGVMMSG